jgi:glyoxylase-like metal-dependent hydrolase (beta-lactamase superfamily II)/rhodanese-related sulfurtransferase
MIFRQLYDNTSSTYTYLLADETSREAIVIDPVFEQHQRDIALIRELGVELKYVIDTHCHADHVTGAWLLQQSNGGRIGLAEAVGADNVDITFRHGDRIEFGDRYLEVRATPGHTDGCLTYVLDDHSMAFTGDALLIRGCGRCDFQQGNAKTLFHSISEQILSLPENCLLYPAHDYAGRTATTVREEIAFNPRIGGGASEGDFVGYMDAMQLPHPKKIDIALPANMVSGKPAEGSQPESVDWAPVNITYAGIPEIDPEWVARHADDVTILDVREIKEVDADKANFNEVRVIPLRDLRERLDEVPRDRPVVTFCRSGRRSAMAVEILKQADYDRVANMAGGFLRWCEEGLDQRRTRF